MYNFYVSIVKKKSLRKALKGSSEVVRSRSAHCAYRLLEVNESQTPGGTFLTLKTAILQVIGGKGRQCSQAFASFLCSITITE